MIVLDASLMVEWLIGETGPAAFPDIYDALESMSVLVPVHWPLEISNALRPDLRSGRVSVSDFDSIIAEFDKVDLRMQEPFELDEVGPLAQFAVMHDLTTYDATYVQIALHHEATLATLDRAMRAAATRLNIPLLPAVVP